MLRDKPAKAMNASISTLGIQGRDRVVGVISISNISSWSATAHRTETASMRAFLT
jgi:hypothetical protein